MKKVYPKIKPKDDALVVERRKRISLRYDSDKQTENEPTARQTKVKLPLSIKSQEFKNKLRNITELVADGSDKLTTEDKNKLERFINKVDDVEKIKKTKIHLQLSIPLESKEKMKQDLTNITNLLEGGIENANPTEVKKINKFLNKLDNIKGKPKKKVKQLPEPGTALKGSLLRITELTTKDPMTLSKKDEQNNTKFLDKVDGTVTYDSNKEKSDTDIRLSLRQKLNALTLSLEFTQSLKTISHLFEKGINKFSDPKFEKVDKFINKLDDIDGLKKRRKTLELDKARKIRLGRARSISALSPEKFVIDETKKDKKLEKEVVIDINKMNVDVQNVPIHKPARDDLIFKLINENIKRREEPLNEIIMGTEIMPKQYDAIDVNNDDRTESKEPLLFASNITIVSDSISTPVLESKKFKLSSQSEVSYNFN